MDECEPLQASESSDSSEGSDPKSARQQLIVRWENVKKCYVIVLVMRERVQDSDE